MPSQSKKHNLLQTNMVKIYTFLRHKQLTHGKMLSSDHCVTDKLVDIGRHIYILACSKYERE